MRTATTSRVLIAVATTAWAVLIADYIWGTAIEGGRALYALVAGVSSLALAIIATSRPATELWDAGYRAGQKDCGCERAALTQNVVPLRRGRR